MKFARYKNQPGFSNGRVYIADLMYSNSPE
ncbi:hypothetical protein B0I22_3440 [Epilithonimonas xixisoli]|uniref:Uncharacterized protein n=1 Tax=Epilithonimonas xixisoli TaxID=1476462 RepID=A0A4R8I3L5_9FLAO|nr:hypothetical protein B0I22_3440 [Epilithonimonas xixisoli]